jgi:hypothetical protein
VTFQGFVSSIKRFAFALVTLSLLTFVSVYLFDQLIAEHVGLTGLFHQTGNALIVVVFGSVIILFIRHSKPLLSRHVGVHPIDRSNPQRA